MGKNHGDVREYKPQVSGTIQPNPEKAELYQEKFRRYLACYHASGSSSAR